MVIDLNRKYKTMQRSLEEMAKRELDGPIAIASPIHIIRAHVLREALAVDIVQANDPERNHPGTWANAIKDWLPDLQVVG